MKRPALTFAVLTWRSGYVLKMLLPPTARRTPLDSSYERSRSASVLARSEEHTSELQSWLHLVCRLLLEKKNPRLPVQVAVPSCADDPIPTPCGRASASCRRRGASAGARSAGDRQWRLGLFLPAHARSAR